MTENHTNDDARQTAMESRERWKRFNAGRTQWTQERLDPYMRNWVAFSADGTQILASAEDLGDVFRILDEKGIDAQDTPLEHLVYADECDFGGAELEYVAIPISRDADSGVGPAVPPSADIASTAPISPRVDP